MPDSAPPRIRPYRPADLDDLYRICLLTADNGQDATPLYTDPQLPGHVYAAPYAIFEPTLAFLAEDADGVAGYVIGARDSEAFAPKLEADWWPRLRPRYPGPPASIPEADLTREQRIARWMHHPRPLPADLAERYPSHLHINLLPRLQGHGLGRRLIETLTTALRDQGSPGLHLHVSLGNQRAAAFYRHVGFTEHPAPGPYLFTMNLRGPGQDA
jgi:ribosomal protein S18 acetylase RimI-like enzyme